MERTRTTVSSWTTDTPICQLLFRTRIRRSLYGSAHIIPVNLAGGKGAACFPARWKTSIFDLFRTNNTFVDFPKDGQMARILAAKAKRLVIPLKPVYLPNESHCKTSGIGRRSSFGLTIIIAWRAPLDPQPDVDVEEVLVVAACKRFSRDKIGNQPGADEKLVRLKETLLPLSAM